MVSDQADEGRNEKYGWVDEEGDAETVEDAEVACEGWEEKELEERRGDGEEGEHGADAARVDAEAAGEFEGQVDSGIVGVLGWMVQEDRNQLGNVIADRSGAGSVLPGHMQSSRGPEVCKPPDSALSDMSRHLESWASPASSR